jgi:hypothetical protein
MQLVRVTGIGIGGAVVVAGNDHNHAVATIIMVTVQIRSGDRSDERDE